ncbi:hypothetical protein [Marinobacterium jannaschii]|uniref:hypothetical protein n=1 Tax=Marinobacterium jannaschii TaxID=64970 RepID=UPI000487BE09|nr:hypothetical protein [Marinobacterium jannaschii]
MGGNVIDFSSRQQKAKEQKKEQKADALKQRFENALPTEEKDPKKKLLNIFTKNKKKPTQKKPAPKDDW